MSGVDPARLAYLRVEPENMSENYQSPIVLHHGLTRSKERWIKLMQPLADKTKRTVYAVDARNHGESEKSDFFNFEILAEDLAHFLRRMDIPRAIFIGHSMGGIAVMKLALSKPELVELLIVEDIPPTVLAPELCNVLVGIFNEQNKCIKELSTSSVQKEGVQQKLRECIYRTVPMIPDPDYDALQKTTFAICETDNGGYDLQANVESITKALLDSESLMKPFVGSYDKPTLFIYGELSQMGVPESKETILKLFPNATLYCMQGVGHEVYICKPKEYEKQVLTFLEENVS